MIELLLQSKSNEQIAQTLGISERTVEYHLKNVYDKLNVSSAREAIFQQALKFGISGETELHNKGIDPLGMGKYLIDTLLYLH